jgi:hypothetical protein
MPLTIFADLRITRRKLFHVVEDEDGGVVFRSRLIGDVLEYVTREGQESVTLTCVADRPNNEPVSYTVKKEV